MLKRMRPVIFWSLAFVTAFYYLEIISQVWFIQLLRGYQIRVWVPPLLLFLWVMVRRARRGELALSRMELTLFAYALFALLAMFINEATLHLTVKYYLIMVAPVWFYFVIVEYFRDNADIKKMMTVLFFCCFVFSVYVFFNNIFYSYHPESVNRTIVTQHGHTLSLTEASFCVNGTTYSRGLLPLENSKYCGILAPAVLFGIWFMLRSGQKRRYLYLMPTLFMIYVIFATLSRVGIVTLGAGIAALIWCLFKYERRPRPQELLWLALSAAAALAALLFCQKNAFLRLLQVLNIFHIKFINDYLDAHSILACNSANFLDPHWQSVAISWQEFLKHPFFGNGYAAITAYPDEHNRYLFILASAGLLTFIPYVCFFFGVIYSMRKTVLKFMPGDKAAYNYAYLLLACLTMFLVKLFNEGMETFFYWIYFSLAWAWIRNHRRDQKGAR